MFMFMFIIHPFPVLVTSKVCDEVSDGCDKKFEKCEKCDGYSIAIQSVPVDFKINSQILDCEKGCSFARCIYR